MESENENAVAPVDEAARQEPGTADQAETTRAASSSGPTASSPAEVVPPKERRARARAQKAATSVARAQRSPEERHAERLTERAAKAHARRVERQRARSKAKAAGGSGAAETAAREHVPGVQKTRQGVVVSDRADKTITVRIDTARRHRRYGKIVRTSRTLHAHDERNDAHLGDTVIVRESRPLSRSKRWRLVQVVKRAK
jgi:small subunit ribosomal protein S17